MNENKLKKAREELKFILQNGLREKLCLDIAVAPTTEQLRENSHENLINYIHYNKLKYYDVIISAGLKRNDKENRKRATKRLINILSNGFKEQLGLTDLQAPTKEQLRKHGYNQLLWFIYKKDLTYNKVIREAGLIPNSQRNKWIDMTLNKASEYLIRIIDEDLKDKVSLSK